MDLGLQCQAVLTHMLVLLAPSLDGKPILRSEAPTHQFISDCEGVNLGQDSSYSELWPPGLTQANPE